jgi:hypothetical protein
LKSTITLSSGTSSNYFSAEAFAVEHYHTTFSSPATSGTTSLSLSAYYNHASMTSSGVVLYLGPNSSGQSEEVSVSGVVGSTVVVTSGIKYSYSAGNEVNYHTNVWLFNDYYGTSSTTGALYKVHARSGDILARYSSGAYKTVKAATFFNVPSFTSYGNVDTLCFVKNTNILFVNVSGTLSDPLTYYGSMVMSNIQSDLASVIPVYDISMYNKNIYRLQNIADGTATTWTYYSYLLSSLDSFVTSISLAAYPAVIPANTISTSSIVAYVKDQFLQPIVGRLVYFSDDDSVGSISGGTPISTDSNGMAQTTYKSGSTAGNVKITAVVSQT